MKSQINLPRSQIQSCGGPHRSRQAPIIPQPGRFGREVFSKMFRALGGILSLLMLAGFLSSCATSTLATRKKERWSAYAALPEEERRLVDAGKIQNGMSEDAVFLAWGKPGQVLEQQNETGRFVIWLYHGSELQSDWYWRYGVHGHPHGYFPAPQPVPYHEIHDYVSAEVVFSGGKVTRWQTLPRPAY